MQPIGRFIPPDDVDMPTNSGADLNNVDLWKVTTLMYVGALA